MDDRLRSRTDLVAELEELRTRNAQLELRLLAAESRAARSGDATTSPSGRIPPRAGLPGTTGFGRGLSEGARSAGGSALASAYADAGLARPSQRPMAPPAPPPAPASSAFDTQEIPPLHARPQPTALGPRSDAAAPGPASCADPARGGAVPFAPLCSNPAQCAKVHEAFSEGELRFRAAFESSAVGMALLAPDGRCLRVNRSLCDLLGFSEDELLAGDLHERTHPDDQWADIEQLREMLAGVRESYQVEKRYQRKDGRVVWAILAASLIRGKDGAPQCIVAQIQDVSARKDLESQVQQVAKLESVGRLAGGVAHEFNNLLAVIVLYADMLGHELPADSPGTEDLMQIKKSAGRAKELTAQLLSFARKQAIAPKTVDLNQLTSGMGRLLARLIGAQVAVKLELADAIWPIKADAAQLEQVLMNLAVNARDAMPNGGKLTIRTENQIVSVPTELGQPPRREARVVLSVADTGMGMPPETLAHLFEPFFTTKAAGKGTGLGLATVYGIIQQNGGRIDVESEVGSGTTFRVSFPSADEKAAGRTGYSKVPDARHGREHLLDTERSRYAIRPTSS